MTVAMAFCMLFAFGTFSASADEIKTPVAPETTNYTFNISDKVEAKLLYGDMAVEGVDNAIRFTSTIAKNAIDENAENFNVKVKTIIAKTEALKALGEQAYTKANLDAYNEGKEEAEQIKYQQVIFDENTISTDEDIDGGDNYIFRACLYNVKAENFTEGLSAVSYLEINGVATQYTETVATSGLWEVANAHKTVLLSNYEGGEDEILVSADKDEYNFVSSLCKTHNVTISNGTETVYTQKVKHGEKLSSYIGDVQFSDGVAQVKNFSYPTAFVDSEGRDCSNDVITSDTPLTAVYGDEGKIKVDGTVVTGAGSKFFDYTTEVVIPDTLGVTEIKASAFLEKTKLTMIKMPTSVTKIGQEAFFGCKNLETVIMPGVTKITVNEGYSAENKVTSCRQFMNCFALKTVVVGESFELALVSVGTGDNRCFYVEGEGAVPNQVNLFLTSANGTVTLHAEGTSVQNMLSVNRAYNLNSTEKDVCRTWRWVDGLPKLSEHASHNYLNGVCLNCGAERVTAGLVYAKYADKDEYYVSDYTGSDTEVYISSTYEGYPVTGIGKSAFYSPYDSNIKKKITKIVMPISVKTIHNEAFFNCKALETIIMPGVTELTTYSAATSAFGMVEKNQFYGCNKLTTIVAGASLDVLYGSGTTGGDQRVFWTDNYTGTGIDIYLTSSDGNLYVQAPSRCNMLTNVVYYYSANRPADEALATTWCYVDGVPTLWSNVPVAE